LERQRNRLWLVIENILAYISVFSGSWSIRFAFLGVFQHGFSKFFYL